jgi:hypothetical protein
MIKAWQQFRSAMTCVRTLELKCSNRGTGVTCSELKFLKGTQRVPNAIGIILSGADPTEQNVFNRSNRQVESLSHRTRVMLSFMECQAAPSERGA